MTRPQHCSILIPPQDSSAWAVTSITMAPVSTRYIQLHTKVRGMHLVDVDWGIIFVSVNLFINKLFCFWLFRYESWLPTEVTPPWLTPPSCMWMSLGTCSRRYSSLTPTLLQSLSRSLSERQSSLSLLWTMMLQWVIPIQLNTSSHQNSC